MIEPQRELSTTALANIKTVRSYNAFGEVARETSALGLDGSGNPVETGSLTYTYNTMGRVIKRESPQVAVTSATGATSNVRPTEEYYYDKSGRMLASRDANGNLTRYTLLAGTGYGGAQALIAETIAADGGVTRVRYDIHGDARQIETPLYNASTAPQYKRLQSFDKLGRLIQLTQEGGLVQSYEYDGLGQRTKYWNSQLGSSKAELTAYDHQGRITQVTAMGGDVTAYAYGWNGALATSGMGTYGGWTKTTTYANAKTLIESSDVFGRATSRTDLGGNVSNYTYDKAGRLLQRSGGSTLTYSYYNTGKLKMLAAPAMWQETIVGSGPLGGTEITTARDTGFEYDKIGNLTKQWTGEAGTFTSNGYYDGEHQWVAPETTDFSRIVSTQTATYDALGRLTAWADSGYQDTRPRLRVPPTSHVFQYDANGNVRRSLATYRVIDAQGAYASTDTTQDYWYAYDAMNRMTISKGQLVSGAVARGTTGISMAFDLGGRRAYAIIQEAGSAKREDYTYDAENRLVETKSGTNVSTPGTKRADFTYDAMGRVTLQRDYDTNGTTILYSRSVTYNDKSQVASDSTATKRGSIIYTANSDYDYGTGSSYALGSPLTIMTYNFENGVAKKTNKTLNTYSWRDGAQLDKTEYWNDWVGAPTVKNTSLYVYDVFGGKAQLREVGIADARPRSVMFLYDLMGQIIKRDEKDNIAGAGDPHEVWYRFSGRQIGYVGNNGTLDTTYAQSIANRTAAQGNGAFFNGASDSTNAADFDLASDSLNSYAQGSNAGMYVVQAGDTLSSIAANLWGDSALWYKLAEINGLTAETELPEGLPLIIPTGVIRDTNNASTFKPYDPNELMGNLSPTSVAPPKAKKCGGIGQIIVMVIAVVVTAIVAPHAIAAVANTIGGATGVSAGVVSGMMQAGVAVSKLGAVATAVGGGIAAAAGSIVSQAFGVASGIQEKFSWNAVALAAISAGIAGSGSNLGVGGTSAMSNALRQGVANAITQGVGVATGLQNDFSWAGVAASAMGSYASANVPASPFNLARSSASLLANAATRSLIEGSDFGDNILAALPDVIGQTIGEMIAGRSAGTVSYDRRVDAAGNKKQSMALNKDTALYQVAPDEEGGRLHVDITKGERSLLDRIGGSLEFVLGVGAGFVSDVAHGLLSLGDYVIRDMGGTVFYWINEGVDAITPGTFVNPYEQSWIDYTNVNNMAGNLIGRAFSDPGGLANDIGTAFSAAVVDSNSRASAFERGMTNPWGKVLTGLATLPFVAGRVGAVGDLGNAGRAGRAGAVLEVMDEASAAARIAMADSALVDLGVTNSALRERLINAGFDPAIMARASNTTRERFHQLFQGTLDNGKSFRGSWGTFETRVATIVRARELEMAGYTVDFEVRYPGSRADTYKWADLLAESDTDRLIVQFETNPTSRAALANQQYFQRVSNARVEIVPVARQSPRR